MWKTSDVGDRRLLQQRRKASLQLEALALTGIDAVVPGRSDLALGVGWLAEQAATHNTPYVAANLSCEGFSAPTIRRIERHGLTIAVTGVVDDSGDLPQGCTVSEPEGAVSTALATVPNADLTVLLSRLSTDEDRRLAKNVPQVDLVVGGGSRTASPTPMFFPGGAARVEAGERGKKLGLARLDVRPGAEGFSAVAQVDQLVARLDRMVERRASAQAQLSAAEDERTRARAERRLVYYDEKLPELQAEVAAAKKSAEAPGHGIRLELKGLVASIDDHAPTAERLAAAKADIEAIEAAASAARTAPYSGPFVGSATCGGCHPAQLQQWQSTPHASAWQTLVDERRHVDLDCYACHATGALSPEGPSHPAQVSQALQGVGCESCHGAGRGHIDDPAGVQLVADPPEAVCTQCHDGEQDEGRFSFDKYRPHVVHGAD